MSTRRIIDLDQTAPDDITRNGYVLSFAFLPDCALDYNEARTDDDEVFSWTLTRPDGYEDDSGYSRSDEEAIEHGTEALDGVPDHWLIIDGEFKPFMDAEIKAHEKGWMVEVPEEGEEWVVYESRDDAVADCFDYWRDMTRYDRESFIMHLGGIHKLADMFFSGRTLLEECEARSQDVGEHFAAYDGEEGDLGVEDTSPSLKGSSFTSSHFTVAYRRD